MSAIEVYHKWSERYFYVIVDTEDLDLIEENISSLSIGINYRTNYCVYRSKNKRTRGLHRLIMNAPSDLVVDHINHVGLDNRKKNLRNVTQKVNRNNVIYGVKNPLYWCNKHLLSNQRYWGELNMNQPSKETAKLLLQLIRKTSLPVILEKQKKDK